MITSCAHGTRIHATIYPIRAASWYIYYGKHGFRCSKNGLFPGKQTIEIPMPAGTGTPRDETHGIMKPAEKMPFLLGKQLGIEIV